MTEKVDFTTPVARFVAGSPDIQKVTDMTTKQPKIDPKTGLQVEEYFMAVAIPKGAEANWWDTPWGQTICAKGFADWPTGQASQPGFAWKVADGDTNVPNRNGKVLSQLPGHAGHWIVSFKTRFAPLYVNADGTQAITSDQFYKGCYVQVHATVRGNATPGNAGVFLNHDIVALSGHGERINTGPDPMTVGFGGALPQGASPTPLAQNPASNVPMGQPTAGAGAPGQPIPGATPMTQPGAAPAQGGFQGSPTNAPAPGAVQYAQPGQPGPATAQPNAASPSEPYYAPMNPPVPGQR